MWNSTSSSSSYTSSSSSLLALAELDLTTSTGTSTGTSNFVSTNNINEVAKATSSFEPSYGDDLFPADSPDIFQMLSSLGDEAPTLPHDYHMSTQSGKLPQFDQGQTTDSYKIFDKSHQGRLNQGQNVEASLQPKEKEKDCEPGQSSKPDESSHDPKKKKRCKGKKKRMLFNSKIKLLQELIPGCDKTDQASILDEAVKYIKFLKLQIDLIIARSSGQSQLQTPNVAQMPTMTTTPGFGVPQYQYYPSSYAYVAPQAPQSHFPSTAMFCPPRFIPSTVTHPALQHIASYQQHLMSDEQGRYVSQLPQGECETNATSFEKYEQASPS